MLSFLRFFHSPAFFPLLLDNLIATGLYFGQRFCEWLEARFPALHGIASESNTDDAIHPIPGWSSGVGLGVILSLGSMRDLSAAIFWDG
jgi:hypothetical protein